MLRPMDLLENRPRSHQQRFGQVELALGNMECSQVTQGLGDFGTVVRVHPLARRQGLLEERSGLIVLAIVFEDEADRVLQSASVSGSSRNEPDSISVMAMVMAWAMVVSRLPL